MLDELMIPLLPSCPDRPRRVVPRRWTRLTVLLVAVPLVAWVSCDEVPLTAPTGSTIALYVNPISVATNGTADVTAVVTESGGTAVQNGTSVSFFTTLGTITPAQAQTRNGSATAKFLAGPQIGDAVVSAVSGGATLSGTATITVSSATAATVGAVVLSANPASVPPAGGSVQLVALVTDASVAPIAGVPVAFTATAGAIASPIVTTDQNGQATTTLTTSVQTTVTATAGGKTATASIGVASSLAVTLTASPVSATVNTPITFTATVSASGGGTAPAISEYRWTFGDGVTATTSGPQTSHAFTSSGTKAITVTAVAATGATATGRVEVVVN